MTLDSITLVSGLLALCLACVTLHAWRLGNERRDVALLGAVAAVFAAGTGVLVLT